MSCLFCKQGFYTRFMLRNSFFLLKKTSTEIPSRQESRQPRSCRKVQRNQQCQFNPHRWDQAQNLRWVWFHGALRVRAVWRRECQILLPHVKVVVQGESSFPYKQNFYLQLHEKGSLLIVFTVNSMCWLPLKFCGDIHLLRDAVLMK